jgi:hypothetical protein
MRYFLTAHSAEDKQSLLSILTNVIDSEPGSRRKILVSDFDISTLASDPRVKNIQPHPEDRPGFGYELL